MHHLYKSLNYVHFFLRMKSWEKLKTNWKKKRGENFFVDIVYKNMVASLSSR